MDPKETVVTTQPEVKEIPVIHEDISAYRLAGFNRRLIAFIIDVIIVFLAFFLLGIVISFLGKSSNETVELVSGLFQVSLSLLSPVYMIYFLYKYGATPGKMAMHIKVVSQTDAKLGVGRLIMREVVGKFLSRFFGDLGFLWNLLDEKRQTWHDKIAHTLVIDTRKVTPEELAAWKAKEKSYLPEMLIISGLPYFIFFLIGMGASYMLPQVFARFPFFDEATIGFIMRMLTIINVTILLTSIVEITTGILLFDKRKITPFLTEKAKKVGLGVYISAQIISFILIFTTTVVGMFYVISHAGLKNTSPDSYLPQIESGYSELEQGFTDSGNLPY